jgi:hypothetical protein
VSVGRVRVDFDRLAVFSQRLFGRTVIQQRISPRYVSVGGTRIDLNRLAVFGERVFGLAFI